MNLNRIVSTATNKDNFQSITDYTDFCLNYLEFIKTKLQAVIVSRNENNYQFFQYKKDGTFNVTRPVNSDLMLSIEDFDSNRNKFLSLLENIKSKSAKTKGNRKLLNDCIYTCQQSIGAALDALPANKSNTARKINGDLFERFIRLIILEIGVDVIDGNIAVPVKIDGVEAFKMRYQHDLIIKVEDVTKAIGSVKTSSKDRIDKIFIDKLLCLDLGTPYWLYLELEGDHLKIKDYGEN